MAPIHLVTAELTNLGITPRIGADDNAIRQLLLSYMSGVSRNYVVVNLLPATEAWTPPPTPLIAEYAQKGLTAFFALQLIADALGIFVLILEVVNAVSSHDAANWLTGIIIISIVEAGLGFLALFMPNRWIRVDPQRVRLLIALTMVSASIGIIGLILLWGVDVNQIAVRSYLWSVITILTVADFIAVTVAINRD